MIIRINNYYLGQLASNLAGLRELTSIEYGQFAQAGAPRMLPDEKIYFADDMIYMEVDWNTMVGTSQGSVYKISIQHFEIYKDKAVAIFDHVVADYTAAMGKPTERFRSDKRVVWDRTEGNVMVEVVSKMDFHAVQVFLTGKLTEEQKKYAKTKVWIPSGKYPMSFLSSFFLGFVAMETLQLINNHSNPNEIVNGVIFSSIIALIGTVALRLFIKIKRKLFR